MNKVLITGRLTADPEMNTANETPIAKFSLAVQKKKDEVFFVDCTAFGRQADFASNYLHKGSRINVVARLDIRPFERNDGTKGRATQLLIDEIEFADAPKRPEESKE